MRPFEILDTTALVDALAEYTARYTKIRAEGGKETDMVNCQETIKSLISEIELRKNSKTFSEPAAGGDEYEQR
jgi:hypothetical protein